VTFLAVFFSLSNKFLYAQCENYPGFAATVTANNNSNSITICAGSNLNLASQVNGIPNGQGGSVVYQWSGGLNNYTNTTSDPAVFSIPSNVSGSYIYTMTATLGGCTISDDIQVTVKDLFYNTPARQKFLKTDQTEYNQCLQIVEQDQSF
jgi:hypothetical protein